MSHELTAVTDERDELDEAYQDDDMLALEDQAASFQQHEQQHFRRSYGGVIRNGKFQRSKVQCIEDFSDEDRNAIISDLIEDLTRRKQAAEDKLQCQRNRHRLEEAQKKQIADDLELQRAAESLEHEKARQESWMSWSRQKDAEARARKNRDADLVAQLRRQDEEKKAIAAKKEEERIRERDRRLRWAARQRAKLELQVAASKQFQVQRLDPLVHGLADEEADETQVHYRRDGSGHAAGTYVVDSSMDPPQEAPCRARPSSAVSCMRQPRPVSKRPASAAARLTSKLGGDAPGLRSFAEGLEQAAGSYAVSSRPVSALRRRPASACATQLRSAGAVELEAETSQSYYRSQGDQAPARRPESAPLLARPNPAQSQELTSAAPASKPKCPDAASLHPTTQAKPCQHAPSSSNPFSRSRELQSYLRRSKSASGSRFKVNFASEDVVVKMNYFYY
eukprot:TRINITY_DN23465_c0_g1_i1.p1 TRINITY_DN23465_c0_g1~~TRINITY_DN23465_c0_g1_i1.p1  ORF type:complete len:451 (-),score=110.35 TRINITY_DN23465_c0_g1_i1:37-1389(-)